MNLLEEVSMLKWICLKKATGVDMSNPEAKSDLASLKAEIDQIDVDKLKTVSVDLSKLTDVAV